MAKKRRLALFRGDRSLWIIIAVLCMVSLLVVYSATASMAYREVGGDTSYYLFRQARFIIFGFFMIIVVHWIDYRSYARYAKVLFRLSVVLVILAYIVGVTLNDAPRWIRIPVVGLTFQPSDILKITLVMVLAQQLGKRQRTISQIPILPALTYGGWKRNPRRNIDIYLNTTQPLLLPVVVACAVVLPANLSTALIIFAVCMIMLWMGRVRKWEIMKLVLLAVCALVLVIGTMRIAGVGRAKVWMSRIENYIQPITGDGDQAAVGDDGDGDFQKEQAKIAIASGKVLGKGPGNSTQRSQLPHPYSDFAYAFIIEEYGAVGGVVVFVLYLWIFYRTGVIVRRCRRPSPALLVLGLSLIITLQAFVNMAVSVGLMPVTGQTLPLISLGGSSVLFTCISFGMILGISRQSDAEEEALRQLALEEKALAEGAPDPDAVISEEDIDAEDGEDEDGDAEQIDDEYRDEDDIESEDYTPEEDDDGIPYGNKARRTVEVDSPVDEWLEEDDEFIVVEHSGGVQNRESWDKNVVELYDDKEDDDEY